MSPENPCGTDYAAARNSACAYPIARDIFPASPFCVDRLVVGLLSNNVYFVSPRGSALCADDAAAGERAAGERVAAHPRAEGFLVDPSCNPEAIEALIAGRRVEAIVLTHYHFDHVGAAEELRALTAAPTIAHAVDAPYISGEKPVAQELRPKMFRKVKLCPVDRCVADGEELALAGASWRVIHTPGHSAGSMCLYSADVLISGDTLFAGCVGRTDFFDSNAAEMVKSLDKLARLPHNTFVLPGHGEMTTLEDCHKTVFPFYA